MNNTGIFRESVFKIYKIASIIYRFDSHTLKYKINNVILHRNLKSDLRFWDNNHFKIKNHGKKRECKEKRKKRSS